MVTTGFLLGLIALLYSCKIFPNVGVFTIFASLSQASNSQGGQPF